MARLPPRTDGAKSNPSMGKTRAMGACANLPQGGDEQLQGLLLGNHSVGLGTIVGSSPLRSVTRILLANQGAISPVSIKNSHPSIARMGWLF